jgi:hypothetical protein
VHRTPRVGTLFLQACAAGLLLVIVGCSETDRTQTFDTVLSPHGEFALIADVIDPWFPQGPHYVAIAVRMAPDAPPRRLVKTELAYDGVPFTRTNIGIRWTSDRTALVCLRATDRPDKGVLVTIEADGTPRAELRQGC